jgi:hypothetical protein
MASHVDLLTELQLLEKVPTLERLRAAQKRRAQQLKKWAQYEQDLQHRKRKHERKRSAGGRRKKVSFEASVALLEASLRNDAEEGRPSTRVPGSAQHRRGQDVCGASPRSRAGSRTQAGRGRPWEPLCLCLPPRGGGGCWKEAVQPLANEYNSFPSLSQIFTDNLLPAHRCSTQQ